MFRKKKKSLKIQKVSAECPDYTKQEEAAVVQEEVSVEEAVVREEFSVEKGTVAPPKDTKKKKDKKPKNVKDKKKEKPKKKKKHPFRTFLIILLVLVGGGAAIYFWGIPFLGSSSLVYVERVSSVMGLGSGNGTLNRYAGVVESQDEWSVTVNGGRIKEVYVKEGDEVAIGDKLFSYDEEEIRLKLDQAELELTRMESELKASNSQISSLERQKNGASSSEKIDLDIQIQSLKANNKKTEYDIKSQKTTIESLKKAKENTDVKSELAGVVKSIDQSVISGGAVEGTEFITILAAGDYRIKAMINEQNQDSIQEGAAVIVRSRVDENAKWTGTIVTVDVGQPESGQAGISTDTTDVTLSSRYPFYVKLDSSEGLLLGQHVYVELDQGQEVKKDGVWLDGYYFVQEEGKTYVWAENDFKFLEKKAVTLGEFDEALGKYQVIKGLDQDDYIAFPTADLHEFARTTREVAADGAGSNHMIDEGPLELDDDSFQEFDNDGTESSGEESEGQNGTEDGSEEENNSDDGGMVGSLPVEEVSL